MTPYIRQGPKQARMRNLACECGSGKKFKRCCLTPKQDIKPSFPNNLGNYKKKESPSEMYCVSQEEKYLLCGNIRFGSKNQHLRLYKSFNKASALVDELNKNGYNTKVEIIERN